MGLSAIIKPLSAALSSSVNKSQQDHEKSSWECQESNPGLLGESQSSYLCALITLWRHHNKSHPMGPRLQKFHVAQITLAWPATSWPRPSASWSSPCWWPSPTRSPRRRPCARLRPGWREMPIVPWKLSTHCWDWRDHNVTSNFV